MEIIDGHIIDAKALKPKEWILDAGCRGFSLKNHLGNKFKYLCLDPDNTIVPAKGVKHEQIALTTYDGEIGYCGWSTGEGNYCYKDKAVWYAETDYKVQCKSIKTLMSEYKIKEFGLAKIDIEGGEYDFLLSIDSPFAKQIAVEFHDAQGHNEYGTHQDYITKLMTSKFGELYSIAQWNEVEACKGMYEYLFKLK